MSGRLPHYVPFDVYRACLAGPQALLALYEQLFGLLRPAASPALELQRQTIAELGRDLDRLRSRLKVLEAEREELIYREAQLQRRNAELEAQLVKDSHNSSRPPSTDPPWAKRTKSLRRPSGRRPGGQVGHRGATLKRAAKPNRVVEHRAPTCGSCQASLAQGQVMGCEREAGDRPRPG